MATNEPPPLPAYRIKCALVCESLKTVLDASTFLDGPRLRVETILRLPEVRRRS